MAVGSLIRQRLTRRGPEASEVWDARPGGPLLWVQAGPDIDPRGLALVVERVLDGRRGVNVLVTGTETLEVADHVALTPRDAGGPVRRFLDHWRPDAVLWSGAAAHPTLWAEIVARDIPAVAVEADPARHPWRAVRALNGFRAVLAVATDGRFEDHLRTVGRLSVVPDPPKPRQDDFEAMRESLETRPLWYACDVPESEIEGVLSAHARAAQLSHRLILFLRPRDGEPPARALDAGGWRWALRSEIGEPDSEIQVLVADEAGEEALWLRLAPLTYLGGTLAGPGPETSPLLAAALGSAVVHGEEAGRHAEAILRLRRAGATCQVSSFDALGGAVDELQSPDRVATLAHSAWHVTTEGAEASAALCETLGDILSEVAG